LLDLAIALREWAAVQLLTQGPLEDRLRAAGVITLPPLGAAQSLRHVRTNSRLSLASLGALAQVVGLARGVARRSQAFDYLHANNLKAFVVAAIARFWGGAPVVWHLHDLLTAGLFSPMNRRLLVTLANRFAWRVVVNSRATGAAFVDCGGRPSLVRVVYNGFRRQPYDAVGEDSVLPTRQELGIPATVPLVGCFSRLSPWKGQHILLAALRDLPGVHGLVVGEALFAEADYRAHLHQLVASYGLGDRVHWLGFRDDIPRLMKACTVIAHTSTEPEPFGRVVVEAQLAQRPIVAAAAGGVLELVTPQHTGWLVPPNDAIALAAVLQEVINSPNPEVVARAYQQAMTQFDLDAVVQQYLRALSD
jgi:glycosyltransferase involved in cell wall biosynthesis